MITFDYPGRLIFLVVLIPLFYFQYGRKRRTSVLRFPFSIWRQEKFVPPLYGIRFLMAVSRVCFWGGAVGLILSWAGPSYVLKEKVYLDRGMDIMLVLDESPSMAAKDFQPENRFEAARSVIRNFVQGRPNDSMGLVSFALEAALRVPPTTDYEYFLQELDALRIMDLGDGTALGMGIAIGVLHLKGSSAKEKALVLLTDGKQNAGEILPETAASIAAQSGIRIYVIGIGTPGETYIEFTNPKTGKQYRGTLEGGFDESLLKRIADIGGGSYFYAGNPAALASVFQIIDSLETYDRRAKIQIRKIALYGSFSLGAFILFPLYFLIRNLILREVL